MLKENKKIDILLFFFVLAISILIGGYSISRNKINLSDLNIISQIKQQILPNQDVSADNDRDGLINGGEKKYGTDPGKRDTDGDGYLDGEEIASGRDPLKPAPNDKLAKKAVDPRLVSQNLTQILSLKTSKTIQNNSILLSAGDSATQFNLNTLDLRSDLYRVFNLPEISASQIKIISDNNQEALKNYSASVIQIFSKNFPTEKFSQPASELISSSFQTQNYSEFKKYTQAYENSFNEIKNLPVPSGLAENHKSVLNIIWILKNTFEAIEQTNQDPMRTIVALEGLESISKILGNL